MVKKCSNTSVIKVTVNDVPATRYRSGDSWVIYKIAEFLKPTRNYCFKQEIKPTMKVSLSNVVCCLY